MEGVYPHEMAELFRSFNPIAAAETIMQDNEPAVLDKNRQQLYEEGIDADGIALPVYRGSQPGASQLATDYYEEKKAKNPRVAGNPSYDGKDTGATFESMTLEFQGEDYSIKPHTEYAEDLGRFAFGHTKQSQEELWDEVICDGMIEAIVEQTGAIN